MKELVLVIALAAGLASTAEAQQKSDPRILDLVRSGKIRVGLFPSFVYTKNPATGELQGLTTHLQRVSGLKPC